MVWDFPTEPPPPSLRLWPLDPETPQRKEPASHRDRGRRSPRDGRDRADPGFSWVFENSVATSFVRVELEAMAAGPLQLFITTSRCPVFSEPCSATTHLAPGRNVVNFPLDPAVPLRSLRLDLPGRIRRALLVRSRGSSRRRRDRHSLHGSSAHHLSRCHRHGPAHECSGRRPRNRRRDAGPRSLTDHGDRARPSERHERRSPSVLLGGPLRSFHRSLQRVPFRLPTPVPSRIGSRSPSTSSGPASSARFGSTLVPTPESTSSSASLWFETPQTERFPRGQSGRSTPGRDTQGRKT